MTRPPIDPVALLLAHVAVALAELEEAADRLPRHPLDAWLHGMVTVGVSRESFIRRAMEHGPQATA